MKYFTSFTLLTLYVTKSLSLVNRYNGLDVRIVMISPHDDECFRLPLVLVLDSNFLDVLFLHCHGVVLPYHLNHLIHIIARLFCLPLFFARMSFFSLFFFWTSSQIIYHFCKKIFVFPQFSPKYATI
jgi:hypothetical protein